MESDDEQCDFDELAALVSAVDSEEEEEKQEQDKQEEEEEDKENQEVEQENAEILEEEEEEEEEDSDTELRLLADLAEREWEEQESVLWESASQTATKQKQQQEQCVQEKQEQQQQQQQNLSDVRKQQRDRHDESTAIVSDDEQQRDKERVVEKDNESDPVEQQKLNESSEEANTSSPATGDAAILAELKRMQEKIRMLESQLSQNSTTISNSQSSPNQSALSSQNYSITQKNSDKSLSNHSLSSLSSSQRPTDVKSSNSNQTVKNSIGSNVEDKKKKNQSGTTGNAAGKEISKSTSASTPKIKPLEEDIFFSASSGAANSVNGSSNEKTNKNSMTNQKSGKKSVANRKAYNNESKKDDSDSDWEGLDGERNPELSEYGREIKDLIKSGPRRRVSHAVNHSANSDTSSSGSGLRDTPTSGSGLRDTILRGSGLNEAERVSVSRAKSLINAHSGVASKRPFLGVPQDKVSNEYLSGLMGVPMSSLPSVASARSKSATSADDSRIDNKSNTSSDNVLREPISGIRIINPLISSARLKLLMEGRKYIRQTFLLNKASNNGNLNIDGDWFTMGVVVSKSEPKVSAKGNNYSIWKLSDLSDCDKQPLTFFLFGAVHKEHWKTSVGAVIGMLNATSMKNSDREVKELALTVASSNQILHVGVSRDFGVCAGKTKGGKKCTNFINAQQGNYCTYHVQAAYKKCSSRRAEIQSGFSGVAPRKSLQEKVIPRGTTVFYGGQSYTTGTGGGSGRGRGRGGPQITIGSLQRHYESQQREQGGKYPAYNTVALNDLLPAKTEPATDSAVSQQPSSSGASAVSSATASKAVASNADGGAATASNTAAGDVASKTAAAGGVASAAATSTAGTKSAASAVANKTGPNAVTSEGASTADTAVASGGASTVSRQNAGGGSVSSQGRKRKAEKEEDNHEVFHQLITMPSVGSMNFVKHLKIMEGREQEAKKTKKQKVQSITASEMLKEFKNKTKLLMSQGAQSSPNTSISGSGDGWSNSAPGTPNTSTGGPKLGRGLNQDLVDLDFDAPVVHKAAPVTMNSSELAKQRAIAKIKASGGLEREDPNAVKNVVKSSKPCEVIKNSPSTEKIGVKTSSISEPSIKKSRLIGNLDLNSPEVKKLLEAKSSHSNLLTKEEEDRKEAYFDSLEQRERMENKLDSITEQKISAVSCIQCKYTSVKAEQRCLDEHHVIKRHSAIRRFYKCKHCKNRCTTLKQYPTVDCSKCGSSEFERTSMLQPRKEPKLESEKLNLRGDEIKYLNEFS